MTFTAGALYSGTQTAEINVEIKLLLVSSLRDRRTQENSVIFSSIRGTFWNFQFLKIPKIEKRILPVSLGLLRGPCDACPYELNEIEQYGYPTHAERSCRRHRKVPAALDSLEKDTLCKVCVMRFYAAEEV
jgi:hypothetical protein